MLKATKVMPQEQGEEKPDEILEIVLDSRKSVVAIDFFFQKN
jgi:hypothetical protein